MKMSAIITAALLGTLAVPAFAATTGEGTRMKVTYDAKRDKYCVSQEITGQRIPARTCRTKAEWLADGAKFGDVASAKQAQATTLAQK